MELSIDVGAIAANFIAMLVCFLAICCCTNIVRLRQFVLKGNKVEIDTPAFDYWINSKTLEIFLVPVLLFALRYMDRVLMKIMFGFSMVGFIFEYWFVKNKCRGLEITPEFDEDDDDENF